MSIAIHHFDTSGEAYDASQCDDSIRDGDVLVCADGVIGFLAQAWPVAVSSERGAFHRMKITSGWMIEDRSYLESARLAMEQVQE